MYGAFWCSHCYEQKQVMIVFIHVQHVFCSDSKLYAGKFATGGSVTCVPCFSGLTRWNGRCSDARP